MSTFISPRAQKQALRSKHFLRPVLPPKQDIYSPILEIALVCAPRCGPCTEQTVQRSTPERTRRCNNCTDHSLSTVAHFLSIPCVSPSCSRKSALFGSVVLSRAKGVSKGVHYIAFSLWRELFALFGSVLRTSSQYFSLDSPLPSSILFCACQITTHVSNMFHKHTHIQKICVFFACTCTLCFRLFFCICPHSKHTFTLL